MSCCGLAGCRVPRRRSCCRWRACARCRRLMPSRPAPQPPAPDRPHCLEARPCSAPRARNRLARVDAARSVQRRPIRDCVSAGRLGRPLRRSAGKTHAPAQLARSLWCRVKPEVAPGAPPRPVNPTAVWPAGKRILRARSNLPAGLWSPQAATRRRSGQVGRPSRRRWRCRKGSASPWPRWTSSDLRRQGQIDPPSCCTHERGPGRAGRAGRAGARASI